jgi:sporulation protein YlmC with PRC-barrel domain
MTDARVLYAGRHLLDKQVVGSDGKQIGNVDDIDLDTTDPSAPTVSALLWGQIALGNRIGGRLGRWIAASAQRLRTGDDDRPRRIDVNLIDEISHTVTLRAPADLVGTGGLESWLSDHVIGRIPGA